MYGGIINLKEEWIVNILQIILFILILVQINKLVAFMLHFNSWRDESKLAYYTLESWQNYEAKHDVTSEKVYTIII